MFKKDKIDTHVIDTYLSIFQNTTKSFPYKVTKLNRNFFQLKKLQRNSISFDLLISLFITQSRDNYDHDIIIDMKISSRNFLTTFQMSIKEQE